MIDYDMFIPITLFLCLTGIVWIFLHFSKQAKSLQHETLRKVIDSGQALTPELIASIAKPATNDSKDFSRGVLLISLAVAIALYGWISFADTPEFMGLSVFPLALGLAYLVINKFKPQA